MFKRKRKHNNRLNYDLLEMCIFDGRERSDETTPQEKLVKKISGECVAKMKNVNPRLFVVTEAEAEAEEEKTIIAVRSFATLEEGRVYAGKDVYMKLNNSKWLQTTKDGRKDYAPGNKLIPDVRFGYCTHDGKFAEMGKVEHEIILFLRLDEEN